MDSKIKCMKIGCVLTNINSYESKDGSGRKEVLTFVCGSQIFEGTRCFERGKLPAFDSKTGDVSEGAPLYTVSLSITVGKFSRIEVLDIAEEKPDGKVAK